MKRLFTAVIASIVATSSARAADEVPFDFEVLQFRAKALAARPYEQPPSRVPKPLQKLTYDEYRDIRFDGNRSWWRREKLPFQMQLFHPGFIYDRTVQVSELVDDKALPIEFSPRYFDYGKNRHLGRIPPDVGFAGVRILHPLNTPTHMDELVVFQGASYFRALGQAMRYGLSARGLALNTGEAGGEEFPSFDEFWVEKPAPDAKEVVIYALLNSPTVTGAYRFAVQPGQATVMHVKAAVYRREGTPDKTFGLAPLTSMFWYGENTGDHHGDLRPEVHDSDGLQVERGNGEWLWRPLVNPSAVRVAALQDENPKGFGLMQRDRGFANYEDLEAAYHIRPSTWVEPIGNWGKGAVRLVEIPTADETNDNMVAFWVPEKNPAPGEALEFEYKLHWFMEDKGGGKRPPAGYVVSTRQGISKTHQPELRRFWVDFDGQYLRGRNNTPDIKAVVTVGEGAKLIHQSVEKNVYNGTWRVAIALKPDGSGRPVELRCFLKWEPHILTETWSYLWNP